MTARHARYPPHRRTFSPPKRETLKQLEEKREHKKDEIYKLFLNVQRYIIEFDRARPREKMEIESERMELEKRENWMKMKLENAK